MTREADCSNMNLNTKRTVYMNREYTPTYHKVHTTHAAE